MMIHMTAWRLLNPNIYIDFIVYTHHNNNYLFMGDGNRLAHCKMFYVNWKISLISCIIMIATMMMMLIMSLLEKAVYGYIQYLYFIRTIMLSV